MKPISLEELNPIDSELKINGKVYQLNKFSLYHQIWANKKWEEKDNNGRVVKTGSEVLFEKIGENDMEVCVELIHKLLKDPSDFGSSQDLSLALSFKDIPPLVQCILDVIGSSQPVVGSQPMQRKKNRRRAS